MLSTRAFYPTDSRVKFYWLKKGKKTYSLDRLEKTCLMDEDWIGLTPQKDQLKIVEHSMLFRCINGKTKRKIIVSEEYVEDNHVIISVKEKYKSRIHSIDRNTSGSKIFEIPVIYDETF